MNENVGLLRKAKAMLIMVLVLLLGLSVATMTVRAAGFSEWAVVDGEIYSGVATETNLTVKVKSGGSSTANQVKATGLDLVKGTYVNFTINSFNESNGWSNQLFFCIEGDSATAQEKFAICFNEESRAFMIECNPTAVYRAPESSTTTVLGAHKVFIKIIESKLVIKFDDYNKLNKHGDGTGTLVAIEKNINISSLGNLANATVYFNAIHNNNTTDAEFVFNAFTAPSSDATLSSLGVVGYTFNEEFSSDIYSYTVNLPFGSTEAPNLSAVATSAEITSCVITDATLAGQDNMTSKVVVTAEDGSVKTYTITFNISAVDPSVAKLSSIKIDGISLEDFDGDKSNYAHKLPLGTTSIPSVSANAINEGTTVITQAAATDGTATIVVTSKDTASTKTYSVTFSVSLTLHDWIYPNSATVNENGQATLAEGSNIINLKGTHDFTNASSINFELFDWHFTNNDWLNYFFIMIGDDFTNRDDSNNIALEMGLSGEGTTSDNGPGAILRIINAATSGNSFQVFSDVTPLGKHHFFFTITEDNKLSLTYNGNTYIFQKDLSNKTFDLSAAKVRIQVGAKPSAIIKINDILPASNLAEIDGINVNGEALVDFNNSKTEYTVTVPYGTTMVPVISVVSKDGAYASAVITPAIDLTGKTIIKVTAEDKTTVKTYEVSYKIADKIAGTTAFLRNIKYDGKMIANFNKNTLSYDVQLEKGTTAIPQVTAAEELDSGATIVITQATSVNGKATIVVTSEDGNTTQTYTINFSAEAEDNKTSGCGNVAGTNGALGLLALSMLGIVVLTRKRKTNKVS